MSETIRYVADIAKQVAERRPVTVNFTPGVPTGATLSSCTVTAKLIPGEAIDNTVLSSTTATISGQTASTYVLGGTSGMRYRLTFTATLSDTSILVEDILMRVQNIS